MACNIWKEWQPNLIKYNLEEWIITTKDGAEIPIEYCPFCGYELNSDGCKKEEYND